MKDDKTILIFGAGKIGRSFIGQLFGQSSYNVVFTDVDLDLVNELNRRKSYPVVIKGKTEETIQVKNVRAVSGLDRDAVIQEVATASIMAVSVGKNALEKIIPVIAEGLKRRQELTPGRPLDIIIAENMRAAGEFIRSGLAEFLPENYPLDKLVGLVETSIGKMVPIVPKKIEEEDTLRVFAESYNTLILEKNAFKNPIPAIKGLAPKENIKAWVDRKLFIHNLGHAATAYWGYFYNPDFRYIWQTLEIPLIYETVKKTMLEAANILVKKYPDEYTLPVLTNHIDDLLMRFQNKALGDTIYRVGCDLTRKLGPNDRLSGAIKLAISLNLPYGKILRTLIVGIHFRAVDENGLLHPSDENFIAIYEKGITNVMQAICGFDKINHPQIVQESQQIEKKLHLLREF